LIVSGLPPFQLNRQLLDQVFMPRWLHSPPLHQLINLLPKYLPPPQGFATLQGFSIAIFEKLFALSTHLEQVFWQPGKCRKPLHCVSAVANSNTSRNSCRGE